MLLKENNVEELKANTYKPEDATPLFRWANGGELLPGASHNAWWEWAYYLWLLGESVTTSQAQPTHETELA